MIREASLDDMAVILPMAIKFNDDYFGIPLNLLKTVRLITMVIEEGEAFISDGGFIGALYVEDLVRDWTVLQEVAWYSTNHTGLKLLDRLIEAGRWSDVHDVRVCHLATSSPIVGKLLQRKGFAPLETSYRLITGANTCPQSLLSLPSRR
jgi:hypothetical protein